MSNLAKEVVKLWKDVIEENKRKRKRDDGEEVKKEDGAKRVKADGGCLLQPPTPLLSLLRADYSLWLNRNRRISRSTFTRYQIRPHTSQSRARDETNP